MLSFKQQQYETDDLPSRWSIGIDRKHVALYVGLALILGFAFGFMLSRSLIRKENASTLQANTTQPPARAATAAVAQPQEFRRVMRILRADTIEVEGIGPVRLIGVETPDGKAPREIYGAHGQNALNYVERLIQGQDVRLDFDAANAAQDNKNDAGETLAYVYTRDGTLINSEMLRQGLAFVRALDQFRYSSDFRAIERDAMQAMRGVWGPSTPTPTPASTSPANPASSPPATASQEDKPKKLAPLAPSAIGPNIPALSGASPAVSNEPTVHVSQSDRLYHKAGCDFLSKKRQTIPLTQARSQGYTACSRCYASTLLKAP